MQCLTCTCPLEWQWLRTWRPPQVAAQVGRQKPQEKHDDRGLLVWGQLPPKLTKAQSKSGAMSPTSSFSAGLQALLWSWGHPQRRRPALWLQNQQAPQQALHIQYPGPLASVCFCMQRHSGRTNYGLFAGKVVPAQGQVLCSLL